MLPGHLLARADLVPIIQNRLKYWRGQLVIMALAMTAQTMLTAFQMLVIVFGYLITSMLCWLSLVWPLSRLHLSVSIFASITLVIEIFIFLMSVYRKDPHIVIQGLVRGLAGATLYFAAYVSHRAFKVMDIVEKLESQDQLEDDRQRQLLRMRRQLERHTLV